VVQADVRGETGATMEEMVGEKRILPERSEWFRSRRIIGTYTVTYFTFLRG